MHPFAVLQQYADLFLKQYVAELLFDKQWNLAGLTI